MRTGSANLLSWLFLGLGVIPTGILALGYGTLGFVTGIVSLAFGDLEGVVFISWALAGVFGLVSLASGIKRFGYPDFVLRRWEAVGIVCGLGASIPFLYYTWIDALWIRVPVITSAACGLIVAFKGAIKD
jgi:hypothetical protein